MTEWDKAHPDKTREYKRNWYYRNFDRIRLDRIERTKKHRKANPAKSKARYMVTNRVASGTLIRQPCQVCGDPKSHAHHEDYSRPLDVEWLCALHHGEKRKK